MKFLPGIIRQLILLCLDEPQKPQAAALNPRNRKTLEVSPRKWNCWNMQSHRSKQEESRLTTDGLCLDLGQALGAALPVPLTLAPLLGAGLGRVPAPVPGARTGAAVPRAPRARARPRASPLGGPVGTSHAQCLAPHNDTQPHLNTQSSLYFPITHHLPILS